MRVADAGESRAGLDDGFSSNVINLIHGTKGDDWRATAYRVSWSAGWAAGYAGAPSPGPADKRLVQRPKPREEGLKEQKKYVTVPNYSFVLYGACCGDSN